MTFTDPGLFLIIGGQSGIPVLARNYDEAIRRTYELSARSTSFADAPAYIKRTGSDEKMTAEQFVAEWRRRGWPVPARIEWQAKEQGFAPSRQVRRDNDTVSPFDYCLGCLRDAQPSLLLIISNAIGIMGGSDGRVNWEREWMSAAFSDFARSRILHVNGFRGAGG
jgi:hypothetical protein